jgi:surfactin synthase thioesterase subunit
MNPLVSLRRSRFGRSDCNLICFPYAGASSRCFGALIPHFDPHLSVWAIEYPGRGTRMGERYADSIAAIAADAVQAASKLDGEICLFGYSMGAIVAFEASRGLLAAGRKPMLLASAHRAPHLPNPHPPVGLDDDSLRNRLIELDGTDRVILEDPEMMEVVLPVFRADVRACQEYRSSPVQPLDLPIACFSGMSDRLLTTAELREWQQWSARAVGIHILPGGHFFMSVSSPVLGTLISRYALEHARVKKAIA